MDIRLIDFFGVALAEGKRLNPKALNARAMRFGYIIHPDCCTEDVEEWLEGQCANYNSTFYKTWKEIAERSRMELAVDQIINYAITYGLGLPFTMNDLDFSEVPEITKYKVILPISRKALREKCINVLYSGIALKQDTVTALCDFVCEEAFDWEMDKVANKEAQCYLMDKTGIMPSDVFAIIRYINYKVTGETQIIKDKSLMIKYEYSRGFDLSKLDEGTLERLSSVFYRFKPLFLGLRKQSKDNKVIVNKLRRMAVKNHKPFQAGFWETVVSTPMAMQTVVERLEKDKPSNFKLIRLIQAIRENSAKLGSAYGIYSMYTIRNGRVWFKKEDTPAALDMKYGWWDALETILYNELVKRLSEKACNVKLPEDLQLACPTSEKNFIGNIPFGSYYDMQPHNMFGIYWREEWGTRDFDLSFIDYNGNKIGWNSDFFDSKHSIIYSGDMTSANPEASEVIYMKGNCPGGMIKVNRYSGNSGSKFKFCVAQSAIDSLPRNYMIDPNTIKFETDIVSTDAESFIGFVTDDRLYMCDFKSGNGHVSNSVCGKGMSTLEYVEVLKRKARSFVNLRKLLEDAGFKIRKQDRKDNPIELDLSELNKDDLIDLFA